MNSEGASNRRLKSSDGPCGRCGLRLAGRLASDLTHARPLASGAPRVGTGLSCPQGVAAEVVQIRTRQTVSAAVAALVVVYTQRIRSTLLKRGHAEARFPFNTAQ